MTSCFGFFLKPKNGGQHGDPEYGNIWHYDPLKSVIHIEKTYNNCYPKIKEYIKSIEENTNKPFNYDDYIITEFHQ